jgi:hypothetical protein
MSAGGRLYQDQRLRAERDRHDWEIAIAQTFQKRGYSRDDALRLARQHFELGTVRRGDNGGPVLND